MCDAGQESCVAELQPAERVADKRVTWAEAGSGFTVCNAGEGEWRQVCWEFKQRPRRSEAAVRALLSSAIYTTCVGTDLLFENEYCRAWDFYLPPGGGDAGEPHHHVLDYAFVYVAKGRLLGARAAARPAWSGNGVCFTHVAVDRLAPRRLARPLRLGQRGRRRELVRHPRRRGRGPGLCPRRRQRVRRPADERVPRRAQVRRGWGLI